MKDFLIVLFFVLLFYFLFLFQTTFAFYANFSCFFPYLILLILFLVVLFENPTSNRAFIISGFTGIMWDFFSLRPLGFYFIFLIILTFFVKFILRNYVRSLSE